MLIEPTQPPSLGLGISVDGDAAPARAHEILADLGRVPHEIEWQEELLLQILTVDALAIVARTVAPFYERGS
jgi:hypothetical protein